MSGSPFLLRNRKYARKILGIHTAGSTYHGFCALLTSEEVQAQCAKFENTPRPVDTPPVGNMKHESWVPQGCRLVQVVAKSESPRMADTSNIIRSPIHGIFPSTKKPAHLKPDATHSPFKMAVHEYFQPHAKTQPQDKKILEHVVTYIKQHKIQKTRSNRTLTFLEALNTPLDMLTRSTMVINTASGYPNCIKPGHGPGKSDFIVTIAWVLANAQEFSEEDRAHYTKWLLRAPQTLPKNINFQLLFAFLL
uniref:RNA-dependent RNA polymerase n=1 Tax=Picornavirales sp. TaxID=1955153 RepID=A0A514D733_9VIRU|nr:MAG: hypothetical protein H4RhizoLitter20292_000004 [Picornavirales sp.]